MTGKTTWLKSTFSGWHIIDLLREDNFQIFLSDPSRLRKEVFAAREKPGFLGVIIDEIQRVPSLLNEVQSLIESDGITFILSGSSARKLKRGGANLLAGRAYEMRIFPVTYIESNNYKKDFFELDSVLQFGALPKILLSSPAEKKRILKSYVGTYLREEIHAEALVRNLPSFSRFLALAAESCGQEVNFSEISRETTVKSKTIKEYYSILEETWIGTFLHPWKKTVRKQLAGSPKFYFFDNGVTNALRETLGGVLSPEIRGLLFEQWVIGEVRAIISYAELEGSLYYWKIRGGSEVDLLVARGSAPLTAVEIKHTSNPGPRCFSGLNSLAEEYPGIGRYLVCNVERAFDNDGIHVMNYRQFFEELYQGRIQGLCR